jgi:membrane protease YdiL (CAAX protease family)
LRLATGFEGSLLLLACLLGWVADINPFQDLRLTLSSILWAMLGTAPLYFLFQWSGKAKAGGLHDIQRILIDKLGPLLNACNSGQLGYLALVAGVTEETLFRGFLQPWMEAHGGFALGLIGSNLIFAAAHYITPVYALLAGLTGLYLGVALDFGGERNLLTPTLIHALYDFLAFLAVARAYRKRYSESF